MIKPPLVTFCSILGLFTLGPAYAGSYQSSAPHSVQGVAEREIARRQENMARAAELIALGDKAMQAGDYDAAGQQYKLAVDLLNQCVNTKELRQKAIERFCNARIRLAKQRVNEGRFVEAKAAVEEVLKPAYSPGCHEARILLAHIMDPEYFNHTMTPKFHANVEQVKQWLIDAKQFYDTGRYDMAFKRYEQVLNIDPYNVTARKGEELVNSKRDDYQIEAYAETRSRALWKLDKAWENPVRKYGVAGSGIIDVGPIGTDGVARITEKLNKITVPKVEFKDATVREAIDFLKQKSRELDTDPDPGKKGVNIVLQLTDLSGASAPAAAAPAAPAAAAAAPSGIPGLDTPAPAPAGAPAAAAASAGPAVNPNEARVTLSLTQVPLMEVLKYITSLSGLKIKIDPYAVSIVPLTTMTEQLITKEFKVPPGFITSQASGDSTTSMSASATKSGGGGGGSAAGNASSIAKRVQAKEFLENNGVVFPQGASANFIPSSSRLIVKNTQDQLDLIESLVEASNGNATQVEIESKFVEITQDNLKELSFDWLLGQFNIGGKKVFGGGGTSGDGNTVSPSDYTFTQPGSTSPVGTNPLTAGNRTGSGANGAISANAIDALLFPAALGASSAAPSIFSVSGVFTDPQFQVQIRALNQKKGVDLLSAPRVTTKSGQRATIEVIREFRYPTEFQPPQIPQQVGGGSSSGGVGGGTTVIHIPITPTTPTAFETRNTGVTLEVEPVVGPDGATIDLNLVPQVVEFEGFINYGSPIMNPASPSTLDALTGLFTAAIPATVLTPNTINQPIFSTRKITTSVSIWDNSTVVIGGLMREDVQKVEDKVPFLGDMPLLGRLFRSSVDQHLKRNLVIFVSARLINPAGDPIIHEEEKEDAIESLIPPAAAVVPGGGGLPELAPAPLPK